MNSSSALGEGMSESDDNQDSQSHENTHSQSILSLRTQKIASVPEEVTVDESMSMFNSDARKEKSIIQ